jgi:hypothetical protein
MFSSSDEEKTPRAKRNTRYYRKKNPILAATKYYTDNVDYGPDGLDPAHVEIGAEADKIAHDGHANIVEWPVQLPPDQEEEEDQRTIHEHNSPSQQLGRGFLHFSFLKAKNTVFDLMVCNSYHALIGKQAKHSRRLSPQPGPSRLCHLHAPLPSPPPPRSSDSESESTEQLSQDLVTDNGNNCESCSNSDQDIEFDIDGIYFMLETSSKRYQTNFKFQILLQLTKSSQWKSCQLEPGTTSAMQAWMQCGHGPCQDQTS